MSAYISTRGFTEQTDSLSAIINGIAGDGGLYVPAIIPKLDINSLFDLGFSDISAAILSAWFDDFQPCDILRITTNAYTKHFDSPAACPVVKSGDGYFVELFHGETCAFKDIALSVLPQLMVSAREQLGHKDRVLILTATSGDTGSAAMNGYRDVPGTGIITFYPYGGVSPLQQRQMTCMKGANVLSCAIKGNFDDCQTSVKRAFASLPKENGISYSSANSINIARLVPQIAYYFSTYISMVKESAILNGEKLSFIVPTGNFGDILAGYYAGLMGLPVGKLVCVSNANRVLTDFFETGVYDRRREFHKTYSPSMDILISSNLERLLYHAENGDCDRVRESMRKLSDEGFYRVESSALERIRQSFEAYSFSDDEALACIKEHYEDSGYLIDPHTATAACAEAAFKSKYPGNKCVILSTASPYKFTNAICRALSVDTSIDTFQTLRLLSETTHVPVPVALAGLEFAQERFKDVINADAVCEYILNKQYRLLAL